MLDRVHVFVPGAIAVWTAVYATIASVAVIRARRAGAVVERGRPRRIAIVRPCAGASPWTLGALASEPVGREGLSIRWIAAVGSTRDPGHAVAVAAAEHLRARGWTAEVRVTGARGPNHKADQLGRALVGVDDIDAVVVFDADVDLGSVDLARLLAPLADDAVGASWLPPFEVARAQTLGDRISQAILGGSMHAFPLLAGLDRDLLVGKAFAVRRDALAAIGGFAALRHHLGEDFELARRLRARGWAIARVPGVVRSVAAGRSARAVFQRYLRWIAVVRAQRPARMLAYPLVLAAAPLLLVAAAALVRGTPTLAAAVAVVTLGARMLVARTGMRSTSLVGGVLVDAWLLGVWLVALVGPDMRWADRRLRLGRDGRLEPVGEAGEHEAREPIEQRGGQALPP